MENLYRPVQVKFRVTDLERQEIRDRMKECGINNMARFLRTMAITGCIIKPDHTDIKQTNYELHVMKNLLCQDTSWYDSLDEEEEDA